MPTSRPDSSERLRQLTTPEAAELLNVTTRYLEKLRTVGGGPRFVRVGKKCVRYRVVDVEAWLQARSVGSTAERGAA